MYVCIYIYRMIKKCLCTWWLQYTKLQEMFKVSPAGLQAFIDTRLTLTPSVIPNSNYVIMLSDGNCLNKFACFLYCIHQVHRDFLITVYMQSLLLHRCAQLKAALSIAVWSLCDVGVDGGSLLSVADRIVHAAVAVIALCHRWPVRNGTTELFTTCIKGLAFIIARTVLCCAQIIWMFHCASCYMCTMHTPFCIKVHIECLSNLLTSFPLSGQVKHVG
jgi:hypothetical protein